MEDLGSEKFIVVVQDEAHIGVSTPCLCSYNNRKRLQLRDDKKKKKIFEALQNTVPSLSLTFIWTSKEMLFLIRKELFIFILLADSVSEATLSLSKAVERLNKNEI